MTEGSVLLVDEISLADDSVLERMNSILEPERTLLLIEETSSAEFREIVAHQNFQFVATMNPGGDFGKKELSPALRNRLVEIWCPAEASQEDLAMITTSKLVSSVDQFAVQSFVDFVLW
jgi:midasin